MEQIRSNSFLLKLNSVHFGTNYLWISFESLILPLELEAVTGNSSPGFLLGIIAFITISIGVIVSLFSGVLSDGYSIMWGKRGPYIILGSIITIIAVALDLLPDLSILMVFTAFLFVQVGSNISSGAYQPLFRDLVSEKQRGKASGINGLYTLAGTAMGLGLSGFLVSEGRMDLSLLIIVAILIMTAILTAFTIKKDDKPLINADFHPLKTFLSIFDPGEKVPRFFWLVGASFLFFLGISGLSFFELYYFKDVLHSSDPSALVAISGIFVLAFSAAGAVVFGVLSDRYGRLRILFVSTIIAGIATALIPAVSTFINFLVLGSFIGAGYGIYFSVSKALASDLSPREDAGKYMAYYNISVGGSSALSTLFFGALLDSFGTSFKLGFTAIFEMSAAFYFVCLILLFKFSTFK
ncbi:MAG: MFS transporter [Candidatus Thermoplasmatota archaeon]|nr:MFS transporter [Candidatus Thermoplasmatota archaeon]